MAEGVGGDFLVDAGEEGLRLDHVEDGNPAEGLPEAVQEGDVVVFRGGRLRTDGEVFPEGLERSLPHRDNAFLVAFAGHPDEAFFRIDVGDEQSAGFGDAQAAAVEDLKYGLVAHASPAVRLHSVDDGGHLLHGEHFREVAAHLGGIHAVAGVFGALAFEDEPVEERAE